MKIVLGILLTITLVLIIGGYAAKWVGFENYEVIIGIGVLVFAFLLMPLFIFYRYKDKDLSRYQFRNNSDNKE